MAGEIPGDASAGSACGPPGPALRRGRGTPALRDPPSAVPPIQRARVGARPPPPAKRLRRLAFVACAVADSDVGAGSLRALVAIAGQQRAASSLAEASHTPATPAPACRASPHGCLPGATATAAAGARWPGTERSAGDPVNSGRPDALPPLAPRAPAVPAPGAICQFLPHH